MRDFAKRLHREAQVCADYQHDPAATQAVEARDSANTRTCNHLKSSDEAARASPRAIRKKGGYVIALYAILSNSIGRLYLFSKILHEENHSSPSEYRSGHWSSVDTPCRRVFGSGVL